MSICPWCKGRIAAAADVCPLCGKRAADHPSISSSGYANFGGFDDFDEPAADLHPDGTAAATRLPIQQSADAFSDDDLPPSGRFEIAVDPKARPVRSAVALPMTPPAPSSPAASPGRPAAPARPVPAAGDSIAIDPYEVAVLADYGPAPEQFYLTPAYAWRVLTRKRDLRRRHAVAVQAVAEAERARDDQLATLAERARPVIQDSPDFATLLQPLLDAERIALDRSSALEQRNAEFGQQVAGVDQNIGEVQQKIQAAQAAVDAARRQLSAHEDVLKRSQALFKRVEIELRNTQEMARAAAGPNAKTAPPEFASRLVDLQHELEDKRRDCEGPGAAVNQALAEVRNAEQALSTLERTARGFRAERAKLEQAFSREAGMRSEGLQHAETERRAALVAIGRQLAEAPGSPVSSADRQSWQAAQALVAARALEAEKLLRARDCEDRDAVKKGLILAGVAALLLIGLLVALVLILGSSQPV